MSPESDQPAVILVADDDDDILDLVCLTLEQAGHETLRAADGDEALRLAREHHPDLCVLDVVMPGRTGIEVVKSLREDPETAGIPVLLLTATVQEKELLPGLEKGSDFYLGKPFSPRELKARVGVFLGPSRGIAPDYWVDLRDAGVSPRLIESSITDVDR